MQSKKALKNILQKCGTSSLCSSFFILTLPVWTVQSKKALKNILQKCVHLPALEPLLHDAPPNILKHVVGQFSKVLPHDSKARRLFVTSGGLKKIQEIKTDTGTALAEYVNTINNCYPEEIVKWVCWSVLEKWVAKHKVISTVLIFDFNGLYFISRSQQCQMVKIQVLFFGKFSTSQVQTSLSCWVHGLDQVHDDTLDLLLNRKLYFGLFTDTI